MFIVYKRSHTASFDTAVMRLVRKSVAPVNFSAESPFTIYTREVQL